ncbi:MAG: phenylalanine--tRNA ligase subunit alpha [Thermoplasmata archaeon]|nr:MAG: phenylalanine--tRNA ligase subunit alpha [Thermoplasmata archaeon]
MEELSINEKKVLLALSKVKRKARINEILKLSGLRNEDEVVNALSWLRLKGLVRLDEKVKNLYALGEEGKKLADRGLPERRALDLLLQKGKVYIEDLRENLEEYEIPIAIGWLKRRGWAELGKEDNRVFLMLKDKGKEFKDKILPEEEILSLLKERDWVEIEDEGIKTLKSRRGVLEEKTTVIVEAELTDKGKELVKKGIDTEEEITQIDAKIIRSGLWKKRKLRAYDIDMFVSPTYGGKPHPIYELIDEVREIFLEMGFEEIEGNYVESSFWNMDALFIPQDHPARDMQDTLYCRDVNIDVDDKLLSTIKEVHENGWKTGSRGWNVSFSEEESKKVLLRTHTTVNTIRYLYENPEPPAKVFSIGKVFRRENLDPTHLPEFYQIEGIVHERTANFRQLIGILKEFYSRMGFKKIRFRPAYFPYTEPSLEIEVLWEGKWMELGGSGIFRPEVTIPAGIENPVLAWGLGLERLAMIRYGLKDIRQLYISDLEWLRKVPIL